MGPMTAVVVVRATQALNDGSEILNLTHRCDNGEISRALWGWNGRSLDLADHL